MYETPEPGYHIANCDYCGEEIALHCDWSEFQKTLSREGWKIIRTNKSGEMTCHVCPACKAEGVKIGQ